LDPPKPAGDVLAPKCAAARNISGAPLRSLLENARLHAEDMQTRPAFSRLYDVDVASNRHRLLDSPLPAKKARRALKFKKEGGCADEQNQPAKPRKRAGSPHVPVLKLDQGDRQEEGRSPSKTRKESGSRINRLLGRKPPEKQPRARRNNTVTGGTSPGANWAAASPREAERPAGIERKPSVITSHRVPAPAGGPRRLSVCLPERAADGSVRFREYGGVKPLDKVSEALRDHYKAAKPTLQILINAALDADLPIEPRMSAHDLHLYLRLNGLSPSTLVEFADKEGFYTSRVVETIDAHLHKAVVSSLQLASKARWMDHLLVPILFRCTKRHLASYLIVYLDMDDPANEIYLVEIIHPILPTCPALQSQDDIFEFFDATRFTKAQTVYITLKTLDFINRGRMKVKEGAPSPIDYFYPL